MIAIVLGIAFLGEILDNWLGFRFAKRYGGSTRSGWGALLGGLVGRNHRGAGRRHRSVIARFLGAFIGAALFEYTTRATPGLRRAPAGAPSWAAPPPPP